jgi:outer membrane protein TolC
MSDSKINKSRFTELVLTAGVVTGIVLMLFPGIWKPFIQSWVEERSNTDSPESTPQLVEPSEPLKIPKPHWVDGDEKIANISAGQANFRTSLSSTDNSFRPREKKEVVTTTELPEFSIMENQAPEPPQDDWEILELTPVIENTTAVQNKPYYDVPEILPIDISDEVVGQVTPMLTEPVMPSIEPMFDNLVPVEESIWWMQQIQQPQIADRVPQPINLDQVILMALQQAPEVQVLNTEPEVERSVIDQSIARFDWSTFVDTVWTDTNEPVGSLLTTGRSGGRFLQQEFALEAGMQKRLATGGDIRVAQNFGTLDNNSDFLDPQDQSISRLVIDYRQPLLRGAGQKYATTQIVLAKLNFEQVENESLESLQSYIVDVVSAYWELYQARATLVQNRRSLERALELTHSISSTESDQQVRAEAAISARQTEVIRAEYEVLNAQDRLVNLTVGPNAEQARFAELIPEPMILPESVVADSEALTYVALRNRPEVGQAVAKIKSASALEHVAINELLPRLDAILSTYVTGLQGGTVGRNAFASQFSTGDPSYSVGFGFELPVGNRAAKSRLQRQKLQTRIFSQQFQKTVGDIVLDVRVASRNLERLQAEINNGHQALSKAQQALQAINQRQATARNDRQTSSLYIEDVLAAQARLTLAEQRLLSSQTEYAIALIDLKRATGELVNGKFRADQYLPQTMELIQNESFVAAPMVEQQWQQQPMPTIAAPTAVAPQAMVGNIPNGKLESVEVTPDVIRWDSQSAK